MPNEHPRRRSLESLKKEAKRWLTDLRSNGADADIARARLEREVPNAPATPTLRDVQLALAREHGFAGWPELKAQATVAPAPRQVTLEQYETMAFALLEAFRTGAPDAMQRHHQFTWHRRTWTAMRTYALLDLGRGPDTRDGDTDITPDDARLLVAVEHGFESWDALAHFVTGIPESSIILRRPVRVVTGSGGEHESTVASSRDWNNVMRELSVQDDVGLDAPWVANDAMLRDISHLEHLTSLTFAGSGDITDAGVQHLSRLVNLRQLGLDGAAVTDRSLRVIGRLRKLETLSLAHTGVTDAGIALLSGCDQLQHLNLTGTSTGDGAIRAMAMHPLLHHLLTGNGVTNDGLRYLHHIPVFKHWKGGEVRMELTGYDTSPNYLVLRGAITDAGMRHLEGLDGLFGLNVDSSELALTAAAMAPLVTLPNLGWLGADARDDWMPDIARMPRLRFLACQDTSAGDDGFAALSRSSSIEFIWGRRCHNLRRRGFAALAEMPALRGLSVSCLNVDDAGIAALPHFPALKELMPMDVPDGGYRHIGACTRLERLILMYCRDTTDAATEHIASLRGLKSYFNSYTRITDRTPAILSSMATLERVAFDGCHALTNEGIAQLARLPRLRELRASGHGLTTDVARLFRQGVSVEIG